MSYCELCGEDIPLEMFGLHTEKFHPLICGMCMRVFHNAAKIEQHLRNEHFMIYIDY